MGLYDDIFFSKCKSDPNYGDDSDLTIKLCLSDMDSTGAQLVFGGRKCFVHETMQEEAPLQVMEVEMGQVGLHSGRHRNGFTPIERYSKEYLIIWCKRLVFVLHFYYNLYEVVLPLV